MAWPGDPGGRVGQLKRVIFRGKNGVPSPRKWFLPSTEPNLEMIFLRIFSPRATPQNTPPGPARAGFGSFCTGFQVDQARFFNKSGLKKLYFRGVKVGRTWIKKQGGPEMKQFFQPWNFPRFSIFNFLDLRWSTREPLFFVQATS